MAVTRRARITEGQMSMTFTAVYRLGDAQITYRTSNSFRNMLNEANPGTDKVKIKALFDSYKEKRWTVSPSVLKSKALGYVYLKHGMDSPEANAWRDVLGTKSKKDS